MSEFDEVQMLKCLEDNPPDISPLVAPLTVLFQEDPETADSHAKLIRITLAEKNELGQLIDFYKVMADWYSRDRNWRKTAHKELSKAFEGDPLYTAYLELSGIDSPRVRVKEALRRMDVLSDMAPGAYVYVKNFGFGIIKDVRHDDNRLVVDFPDKPGHELEMGFAAQVTELISDTHLYARKHIDPDSLNALIEESPAEVVRIALKSFGPTPVGQLQTLLIPEILPESQWKSFWAKARKELKDDNLVIIPSKRSEPMELLANEKTYDAAWFRHLSQLRHMETILNEIEELLDAEPDTQLNDDAREAVADRLRFVVVGGQGKHHDFLVRVWLLARKLEMTPGEVGLSEFLAKIRTPDGLLEVVRTLSAALTKGCFNALSEMDPEATADALLGVLPELEYSALNEAIQLLFELGHEDKVCSTLRPGWNNWTAEVDVMYWLSQHQEKISAWNYGNTPDLVARLLKVLNRDYAGNRLRVQNQLREIFRQPSWLQEVLGAMDERQRRAFTQGVKDSTAWEQLDKASVLGQIVKIDGSLQDIVSGKAEEEAAALRPNVRVSSHRSYREKQKQLDKLINKDIPENSREIAVAREYGDLRENFEYKAAKDTQRLLMARKAEIEAQLREVKPTDFTEFLTENAGLATTVVIRDKEGEETEFHILGEWDSDMDRNVISAGSGMAKALAGHAAGDTVEVPGEHGVREVTLVSVGPLAPSIRAWLDAES
ncbi:MAG: GreA/GreB family elongation factor [Verrucomicrobia bacterium]|nr:GreA/GreB family elongation factor [Verrucomicrobiota bacterium]MCH8511967.1 GreA/GreB family elongation factor [Kiritimatiellia bacterium]